MQDFIASVHVYVLSFYFSDVGVHIKTFHRDSTDDLLLLQISCSAVRQTRNLQLSRNTLYLLSPRLCFFIVLTYLFVNRDDSLTS